MYLETQVFKYLFEGWERDGFRVWGLLSYFDEMVGVLEPGGELEPVET